MGMVALRINYPYQAGSLVAYVQRDPEGNIVPPFDAVSGAEFTNRPVIAEDGQVQGGETATFPDGQTLTQAEYTLVTPTINPAYRASTNRGEYGLGELGAYSTRVRPYRKVLTAQSIYRREVFVLPPEDSQ